MGRFNVMIEEIRYRPFFKVFEAETAEQAEKKAEEEIGLTKVSERLEGSGWRAGDDSWEWEVRPDVTEEVK